MLCVHRERGGRIEGLEKIREITDFAAHPRPAVP
jgi:hypothetical protein